MDRAEDLDISVELMRAALAALTGYQTPRFRQADPQRSYVVRRRAGAQRGFTFCDNFVQNGEDGTSGNLLSS